VRKENEEIWIDIFRVLGSEINERMERQCRRIEEKCIRSIRMNECKIRDAKLFQYDDLIYFLYFDEL
jgi:hypothetical protein